MPGMVDFVGKLCLAPMVRSGELPTRLMSLRYGADLVWTPEIVDKKITQCQRLVNDSLRTIDYVESLDPRKVVFRTFPSMEKGKLIFQVGSSDPILAVQAGLKVINDVDGIDLNCGCPKPFSTHSGMGAALLRNPTLLEQILKSLVNEVGNVYHKPISCKIRLLNESDPRPTIDLLNVICKTGISNVTIHCRTPSMRNKNSPVRKFLPELLSVVQGYGISLIINGNIQSRGEYEMLQSSLGNGVGCMIAECAEANPTVFLKHPLPYNMVVKEFVTIASEFDNHPSNTKYVLLNQIPGKSHYYQQFCKGKSNDDLLKIADQLLQEQDCKVLYKNLQKVTWGETTYNANPAPKKHFYESRLEGEQKKLKPLVNPL